MRIKLLIISFILCGFYANAIVTISGVVTDKTNSEPLVNAHVFEDGFLIAVSNNAGEFQFESVKTEFIISVSYVGYADFESEINSNKSGFLDIKLDQNKLDEATVLAESNSFVQLEPRAVEDFTVYAGKKADLISLDAQLANSGTNNARQTFSRVSGLNIWQADAGGLQLSIGSRGLDPNRTAHFNVRQNGTDISAEPLGYPEAYYTPALQSVKRIEIIRGAASLQYGPQFGGMLNFSMKNGNRDKKIDAFTEYTRGSFNLNNLFTSIGGQLNKVNYYLSGNLKLSDGWTDNSSFKQTSFYGGIEYDLNQKSTIKLSASHMEYEAQQSGGLTDLQFQEDPFQSIRERNWFCVDWFTSNLTWNYRISNNSELESKFFMLNASRSTLGFAEAPNRVDTGEERDIIHGEFNNYGNETRLKSFHSILKHSATFIAGVRAFHGTTLSQQKQGDSGSEFTFNQNDGQIPNLSDYTYTNENYSAFIEEVLFLKKWKITPGVRLELIKTGFEGEFTEIRTDGAGNVLPGYPVVNKTDGFSSRPIFLFGLGVERSLTKSSSVLLNFTRNYRPVNFSDLFISRPAQAVDSDVKDESGYSFDIEFKGVKNDVFKWSVDFYALKYEDKIGSVLTTQQDPLLGNRIVRLRTNVNDGSSIGVDLNFEMDALSALQRHETEWKLLPFGSLSLNRSKYSGSTSKYASITEGNFIEKAPNIQAKGGFRVCYKELSIEGLYSFVGEQFSDATNSEYDPAGIAGLIPSYSVLDLSAQYRVAKFQFKFSLNNALNKAYFVRRASAYPGPGIISSAPRNFSLGISYRV